MSCTLLPGAELAAGAGGELSALDITLKALRPLLAEPEVTELCINRPREVFIEGRGGWRREELPCADFDWCRRLAKLIANVTRQRIDESTPLLSASLPSGFDSIRSVTASAVGALDYVSRQTSAPLSVRQWVRSGAQTGAGGVLFLPYRAGQVAALRSTISAWMRLAIFEAMQQEEEGDQRLWFVVDELDALGQIDGLKDALARLRKFGGRCVLGFQSIAQVSSTYGHGEAQTLVENCGNSLILRCSGSEHGGTSQFASRLIGEREVMRVSTSRSRRATELLSSVTRAEHVSVESAVMGAEIEQLPDLSGYLKIASQPQWLRVGLRPMPATRPSAAVPPPAPVRLMLRGPHRSVVPQATVPEATDGMEAGPS